MQGVSEGFDELNGNLMETIGSEDLGSGWNVQEGSGWFGELMEDVEWRTLE